MSIVNVKSSRCVASTVHYVLYGSGKQGRQRAAAKQHRAAALSVSVANGSTDPSEFVRTTQAHNDACSRKVEAYTYILAFSPDEFDVHSSEDAQRVCDIAEMLTNRMHSADYLIAVHSDAKGHHLHAHIVVANHDNLTGRCLNRNTSWAHGVHQLNDELMQELGLQVLPDPGRPKPDWDQRREDFEAGGFEQVLGDIVADALCDPRCVDQAAFESILANNGVRLAVTKRDGWSYKMRRKDSGKLGRRKASSLTPEFTSEGAQEIFEYHAKKMKHNPHVKGNSDGDSQTDTGARRTEHNYGDLARLDLETRQRRAASVQTHKAHLRSDSLHKEHRREHDSTAGEPVDLASRRAALDRVRRDAEQAERDREDDRRRRRNAHRITTRDTPRRYDRTISRLSGLQLDTEDQQPAQDDGFEL